jgi:pyrroloquinoline quinone biosynthesis protein D
MREIPPMTNESRPILARGVRLRLDPITEEPLLLYPEGFLPLDTTTHDILTRCKGDLSIDGILLCLSEEYEAEAEELREDVVQCLEQLRQEMLVTW